MRIKKKANFIVGVVDVICGIALVITCIVLCRTERIVYALFPLFLGIYQFLVSIETKKQHQKRIRKIIEIESKIKEGANNAKTQDS